MEIWICDDDVLMTESIASKVKLRYPTATVRQFQSGFTLLAQASNFDILILDIEMPDINGLDIAAQLRARHKNNPIIFVTAHEKYVFQAFDVQAFHYLVKPFSTKKFYEVLQEAYENRRELEVELPYLLIKSGFELHKVFHHEVYFLEVLGRRITVHIENNTYQFIGKLQVLEEQLGESFFRIHRSFLVHFKYIASYDKQQITLDNGITLSLSQKKYTAFVQAYLQYIKQKGYLHT